MMMISSRKSFNFLEEKKRNLNRFKITDEKNS